MVTGLETLNLANASKLPSVLLSKTDIDVFCIIELSKTVLKREVILNVPVGDELL
jgi:hypothetical protein